MTSRNDVKFCFLYYFINDNGENPICCKYLNPRNLETLLLYDCKFVPLHTKILKKNEHNTK